MTRHTFVWLNNNIQYSDIVLTNQEHKTILKKWINQGTPFIKTRSNPKTDPRYIDLGLALPPDQNKLRIAFQVPVSTIRLCRQAPLLNELVSSVSFPWRKMLQDVMTNPYGIHWRVYGSFAWEYLTGLNYVHNHSDIDLLWLPTDEKQLSNGIMFLQLQEDLYKKRLDGEVIFPDGSAVAWREFLTQENQVLVKRSEEVTLCKIDDLFRLFYLSNQLFPKNTT